MALYEIVERPTLDAPVLVCALDGWVDAGIAAQAARDHLLGVLDVVTVATFDADVLLDQRARRPVMHLEAGLLRDLEWPSIELKAASDEDGNDLLLLVGAEPDHLWRAFTNAVVDLALDFGSRMTVSLGAYPAPAPHTRPTRMSVTASDESLTRIAQVLPTLDVPGGIHAAIEHRSAELGLPAAGLWAQVPHYASGMPCPPAALALLDSLAELAGLSYDTAAVATLADAYRHRIDELVAANPEHTAMVRRLEQQYDEEAAGGGFVSGDLPSGDELAAEVERFLREQGG